MVCSISINLDNHFLGGTIINSDFNVVGCTHNPKEGDLVSVEVDLRDEDKEKRRIAFIINDENAEREKTVIAGVPQSIKFGVSPVILFDILSYSLHFFVLLF